MLCIASHKATLPSRKLKTWKFAGKFLWKNATVQNKSELGRWTKEELLELGIIFKFKYSDVETLIQSIYLKFNLKFICVTNGSINSSIYDGNNFFTIDSFKVKSIDNLGAGDNFLACFIISFSTILL